MEGDLAVGLSRPNNFVSWMPTLPTSPAVLLWQRQIAKYRRMWEWFTGEALLEEDPEAAKDMKNGERAYLYPLRINPIKWTCMKHAAALFGDVPDDSDSMVNTSYVNDSGKIDARCEKHADRLSRVWYDSNGKELLATAGIIGQFLGGSFFKVKYDPLDPDLVYGIKIETVVPDFVLPIYNTANFWELEEVYVMYYIGMQEAETRYGLNAETINMGGKVLYWEHWTKTEYEIKVGGVVPNLDVGGYMFEERGKNPFGFVPFVYIPHPERVGAFYGMSHVDDLDGLTEELNSRMADVGDYVSDNSHSMYWVRNVTSKLDVKKIEGGRLALWLGNRGAVGNAPDPEIGRLDSAQGSNIQGEYTAQLIRFLDRASSMAEVGYGEDKGSQRSAATLSARMWTMTSHIKRERVMFTTGIMKLNQMVTKMMILKGIGGVTKEDLLLRCRVRYYPMLPMDRGEQVQEMVLRKQTGLISTYNAVQKLADGEDVSAEVELIEKDKDEDNERLIEVSEAKGSGFESGSPNTGQSNSGGTPKSR